jgi:hypothetical protein
LGVSLAACGRFNFVYTTSADATDATSVPRAQTLTIASTSDDGDINNATLQVDGESGGIDYAGYWTASSQSSWAYYRFRLAEGIPAGAKITANTRLKLWGAGNSMTGGNALEFTCVNAELATSTTAPTAPTDIPVALSIFADTFGSGWNPAGTGTSTATVQWATGASGHNTLLMSIGTLSWYDLTSGYHNLRVADFETLSFDINVGDTPPSNADAIGMSTLGVTPPVALAPYVPGGHLLANTWHHIVIPSADLIVDGQNHIDFQNAASMPVSFVIDSLQLTNPTADFRVLTAATVLWPNANATAYVVNDWNTSPSLAPVVQELVDRYGGLAQGDSVTLWIEGPRWGFGYTGGATYLAGYTDYAADAAHAAQLTIEYR